MMNKMDMPWLRFVEGAGGAPDGAGSSNENESPESSDGDSVKDWKAEAEKWKQFSRTWEERAKSNEDEKKRLNEIEDANKSELERAVSAKDEAEKAVAKALEDLERERGLRLRSDIAAEFGVSTEDRDLFLTATDEETLRKQAEALAKRRAPENPQQGRGGGTGSVRKSAESWAESLLGKK